MAPRRAFTPTASSRKSSKKGPNPKTLRTSSRRSRSAGRSLPCRDWCWPHRGCKERPQHSARTAHGTRWRLRPTYPIGLRTACSQGKAGGWSACWTPKRTQRRCAHLGQNLRYRSVCRGGEEEDGQHGPTTARHHRAVSWGRSVLGTGLAPRAVTAGLVPSCPMAVLGFGVSGGDREWGGFEPTELENSSIHLQRRGEAQGWHPPLPRLSAKHDCPAATPPTWGWEQRVPGGRRGCQGYLMGRWSE